MRVIFDLPTGSPRRPDSCPACGTIPQSFDPAVLDVYPVPERVTFEPCGHQFDTAMLGGYTVHLPNGMDSGNIVAEAARLAAKLRDEGVLPDRETYPLAALTPGPPRIPSRTGSHPAAGDALAVALIAELINAAEAVRTAMYDSDAEIAWQPAVQRWDAAVANATVAYPDLEAHLEDR